MNRRPNTKTLKRVFDWLAEYGFSVYGAYINPETGEEQPGCRDYSVEEILKITKMINDGSTWREGDGS